MTLFCLVLVASGQPRVAVVREEGSNGDREMSVSLYEADFEVSSHQVAVFFLITSQSFCEELACFLTSVGI